ncbi:MAG: fumarylacetoacetate hydrolase family protein [Gordonia paraffinivorans]
MSGTRQEPAVIAAFERLRVAHETGVPVAPIRDLTAPGDADRAYAIQQMLVAHRVARGATVVGHKVGLTSPVVQRQLSVDRPDFGVLLDDMRRAPDLPIDVGGLIAPRVEAEIAFVLGEDLADGPIDVPRVRGAVDHAVAALEIVDSRIADWDITFVDTVADNASSGLFVLGTERRSLADVEPVSVRMQMTVDGVVVSSGSGADCLGDPLEALRWLATTALDHGRPLRGGDVVLSGALGPMVAVTAGSRVTATITGLGSVTARFIADDTRRRDLTS